MAKKDKNDLSALEAALMKEYGSILLSGDMLVESEGRIIPTTLGLDIAFSGGLVEGTILSIGGVAGSGKTTLCLEVLANAQKMGKKTFYIDVEGRLRTKLLGCIKGLVWNDEQEKATGIPQLQVIRSTEGNFLTAQKYLNIIDKIFLSEPGCIVVLDSIAAMCSEQSKAVDIGESKQMTIVPTLMYDFLRKIAQVLPPMKSNLMTITHLQDNPGGWTGPKEMGGNAIKFFSSYMIRCLSAPEVPKEGQPKIGKDSVFKVIKSAIGPPAGSATVFVRYGRGCDKQEDVAASALELGFIEQAGAWYNIVLGERVEKVQGWAKVIDILRTDQVLCDKLEAEIRQAVFGTDKI